MVAFSERAHGTKCVPGSLRSHLIEPRNKSLRTGPETGQSQEMIRCGPSALGFSWRMGMPPLANMEEVGARMSVEWTV